MREHLPPTPDQPEFDYKGHQIGALISNTCKNLCTDAVLTAFNLTEFSSGMCDSHASSSNIVSKNSEWKRIECLVHCHLGYHRSLYVTSSVTVCDIISHCVWQHKSLCVTSSVTVCDIISHCVWHHRSLGLFSMCIVQRMWETCGNEARNVYEGICFIGA